MKNSLMTLATGMALVAMAQTSPAAEPTTTATLNSVVVTTSMQTSPVDKGVMVAGIPVLDQPALLDKLNRHIGQTITRESLQELLAEINAQLAAAGESFSVASLPEQDISSGRLKVLVIRATIGEVRVRNAGAGAFADAHYRTLLRLKPGDVLAADTLDADVDWINRSNSYRHAQVMTQPGKEIGQTDLELLVTDQRPYGFSAAYDNNGTRITGRNRITLGAGWGNVLGLDHQLSYSLNASPDFDRYVAHSLGYVIPLPWRHLLSFTVNASHLHPDLPAPFSQRGNSSGISVRYDVPLKRVGAYSHETNIGFDYKRSDNNLLFSQTPVTNTLTTLYQFNLAYSGTLPDPWGQTSINGNWVHSPGNGDSHNTDAALQASRAGAKARYNYWQLGVERTTPLPKGWMWTLRANLQQADSNLLGSEQLSGGGFNSVRGFAEAVAFGDEGHLIRTEILSPTLVLAPSARIQGLVFYDEASLSNKNLLPGERARNRLSSIGWGLRGSLAKDISLRLDVGTQLARNFNGAPAERLIHLGISSRF